MNEGDRIERPALTDRWAVAALALFAALFFIRPLTGHGRLFMWDLTTVWEPIVSSALHAVSAGSWPLWDPYRGFGKPLLADPNGMLAYPFTWLNLFLPAHVYYVWFVVVHLAFSATGTYALSRRWGLGRTAAFVAAAVWIGSGPLLSIAYLWHHFAGASWFPWVFLAADAALEPRMHSPSGSVAHGPGAGASTFLRTVAWGAAWGAQMLAGSADMVLMGGLALLSYVLVYHVEWRRLLGPANRRAAGTALGALVFALALSAVQWMPAFEMLRQSARRDLPPSEREAWSLHPLAGFEMAFPFIWRQLPQVTADPAAYVDLQGGLVSSVYLGIPGLILVAAALTAGSGRRRVWLAVLGAVALAAALGRYTPAYRTLVLLVPPLRIARYPVKAMEIVGFCWSLLAGFGVEAWLRTDGASRRWRWGVVAPAAVLVAALGVIAGLTWAGGRAWEAVFVRLPPPGEARAAALAPTAARLLIGLVLAVGAFLLVACRRHLVSRPRAAAGLAVLVAVDLLAAHWNLHPLAPIELFAQPSPLLGALEKVPYPRVYSYNYSVNRGPRADGERRGFGLGPVPAGWSRSWAWLFGLRMDLYAPINAIWGVYGSYDVDLLRLYPAPLQQLVDFCWSAESQRALHLRVLQMGGVHDVIGLFPDPWWNDLEPVATIPGPFERPFQVLKVPDPLERAYVVGAARVADGEEALRRIADPAFDPRREVLLASSDGRPTIDDRAFAGSCRLVRLAPDRIVVEAKTERPGYLVLLDAYDPGWKATVGGVAAPVIRANLAFRAVPIGAGVQQIELVYRPRAVLVGAWLSLAALVLGLTTLSAAVARRRSLASQRMSFS